MRSLERSTLLAQSHSAIDSVQRFGLTTDARGRMEGFHLQFCLHEQHRGNTVQHNESEERLCQQSCTVQRIPHHGDPCSFVASEINKWRKTMPNMKSVLK